MNKHFLLAAVIASFAFSTVSAQRSATFNSSEYTTSLGVKLYPGAGGGALTLKHFLNQGAAVEALASAWDRGSRATGLYEFHWDIPAAPGLKWYVGPGAHVGIYKSTTIVTNNNVYKEGRYLSVGVDGVIGVDYKFNKIPLAVSADWQPSFDFGSKRYNGFGGDFGGISARYTF